MLRRVPIIAAILLTVHCVSGFAPAADATDAARRHWAFQPPRAVAPPAGPASATPIDRFLLARLSAKNLKPVAPADKLTLIRRATFDLTGLPPTPEEIDAFLGDTS